MRLHIACMAALLGLTASGEELEKIKAAVKFDSDGPLSVKGGRVILSRVYGQEGAEPLAFEAEDASLLDLQSSDKKIEADPGASGGRYIHFVKMLAFRFTVRTPGKYQVWYHCWFPLKAEYNHHEYMDDSAAASRVEDSLGGTLAEQQWHWVKGPTYRLDAGAHEYVFPSPTAYCGGARLDRVVLMPEGQELTAPDKIPNTKVVSGDSGETVSSSVKLQRIAKWSPDYRTTGLVDLSYSYDRGKTWAAFAGQPGEIVAVPDAARVGRLCFKVSMTAKSGTPAPALEGFALYVYREP
jgi:hypothetical protein